MSRRRRMYKFTEKSHSKRAIGAFAGAVILLMIYLAFLYKAYKGDGGVSAYYGSVGVMAMILSLVAFVVSVTTLGEEDSFQLFPRLALLTSFLSGACWIGTYVLGFML